MVGPSISLGEAIQKTDGPALAIISSSMARELMGAQVDEVIDARNRINKGKRPKSVTIKTPFTFTCRLDLNTITGTNVLGYIEGSDPLLKDELVVVTAHFDHLGKRGDEIFNGANDNGSGTSTVLEIAQAFSLAKQKGMGPRRSVLTMLVTGEEKGLLGSKYYVQNPVFPLENTVVDVNVDMVGRIDKKHENNPDYIYVIGSDRLSSDLHRINEETNAKHSHLELDYTYNAPDDPNRYYQRSDHYNFAEKGIPVIFYFNGSHEDYHRPSDTIEKIDFDIMAKIGRLVFYTTWDLANRDERIRVDVTGE
jgi:Zn-dependent M28 family amino/carboxypeptidase